MQLTFSYAPMARSMGPMLSEEAFHLATGMGTLKRWVAEAAADRGNVSIELVQQHLSKWIPRGLEMFGDERGGGTNVELGLKNLTNGTAMARYHRELGTDVVDVLNAAIVRARAPELSPDAVQESLRQVLSGEMRHGLRREDLLRLPDTRFFRRRGPHAFQPVAADGAALGGGDEVVRHLRKTLPAAYVTGKDFSLYCDNLRKKAEGGEVKEGELPFYG
jgi:hypothetical protein